MPRPDVPIPFRLPYRQMIHSLPPRRDPFTLVPDEEDEPGDAPAPDPCRRFHCDH